MDILKENKGMLETLTKQQWDTFIQKNPKVKTYTKGQIIHLEGEPSTVAECILEGRLQVKRYDLEGRTLMIERFVSGDMIGANLIFSSKTEYPMSIIAESNCSLLQLEPQTLLGWCQENTFFLCALLKEVSDKANVLINAVNKTSTGTLREKLQAYFEEILEVQGNTDRVVELMVTKKELAERFGVARTSLSRELHRMAQDGLLVQLDSKRIKLY